MVTALTIFWIILCTILCFDYNSINFNFFIRIQIINSIIKIKLLNSSLLNYYDYYYDYNSAFFFVLVSALKL